MVDEHVPAAPVAEHLEVLACSGSRRTRRAGPARAMNCSRSAHACARTRPAAATRRAARAPRSALRLRIDDRARSSRARRAACTTAASGTGSPRRRRSTRRRWKRWGSSGGRSASFSRSARWARRDAHDVLGELDGALRVSPHPTVQGSATSLARWRQIRRGVARRASSATPCASDRPALPRMLAPARRQPPNQARSAAGLRAQRSTWIAGPASRRRAARAPRAGCGARARPGCGRSAGSSTRAGSASMTGWFAIEVARVPGHAGPVSQTRQASSMPSCA